MALQFHTAHKKITSVDEVSVHDVICPFIRNNATLQKDMDKKLCNFSCVRFNIFDNFAWIFDGMLKFSLNTEVFTQTIKKLSQEELVDPQ